MAHLASHSASRTAFRSGATWLGALALVITTSVSAYLLLTSADAQAEPLSAPGLSMAYPGPVDLVADKIEVTQGIQDLNNSVRLVANKRTFVRFHVHSSGPIQPTTARLDVQRADGSIRRLSPLNPGQTINVVPTPDRAVLQRAFLFELPDGFKSGTVTLTARVNPDANQPANELASNNQIQTSASFETVPPLDVVLYRTSYKLGSTTYAPTTNDAAQLASWLRRAYPLSDLRVWNRTSEWGSGAATGGTLTNPTCGSLNSALLVTKILDSLFGWSNIPTAAHYYALVADGGGFMRGCAMDIPTLVASGPAGSGDWGWDFDGTYGDWYGAHELAHTVGRPHAMFCGALDGAAYPYAGGRISPVLDGNDALYGFDIADQAIYPPSWKDVMTYCVNQWVSDYTYEALMTYFQNNPTAGATLLQHAAPADRLLVAGVIDPHLGTTQLDPIYLIPSSGQTLYREPGAYAIVLLGAAGQELARYPFTPRSSDSGPTPDASNDRDVHYLIITELVEYVPGTQKVVVEGPGGQTIAQVAPGTSVPTVQITAPAPGASLTGDPIHLAWLGHDADNDPLTYMVQYSHDNGATWGLVAQHVITTTIDIPRSNLIGSNQARFRVWVSDGLNTASATLSGTVAVPGSAPSVQILAPAAGTTFARNATVGLVGSGYSSDTGSLTGVQLEWRSDKDGALGTGENLSIATLSTGNHLITLRTPDGHGGYVQASQPLAVISGTVSVPNALLVGPTVVALDPVQSIVAATLIVDNANATRSIGWTATTSQPWLALSSGSGLTPAQFTATYQGTLAEGTYSAQITVTSNDVSGQTVVVPVHLTVGTYSLYLPLTQR